MKAILKQIPESDLLIIEAGTPFVKRYGVEVVQSIREVRPNAFVVVKFFIYWASSDFFIKYNYNLNPYILPKALCIIMIIITIASRRSYVF